MINNKTQTLIEREFSKKGYYIFDVSKENKKYLEYLRSQIKNQIIKNFPLVKSKYKDDNEFFENIHKFVSQKRLNEFRLSIINSINNNKKYSDNYYLVAKEGLDILVGNEIAMQKNLTFQYRSQTIMSQIYRCIQIFMQVKVLLKL